MTKDPHEKRKARIEGEMIAAAESKAKANCCRWFGHPMQPQWADGVHAKAERVDARAEEDWHSLCLGWAMGKGLSPEDAREFALHIRYHTDLG